VFNAVQPTNKFVKFLFTPGNIITCLIGISQLSGRNWLMVHSSHPLATCLVLQRRFLRLVKTDWEAMAAWIENMGVVVSMGDMILALTTGLDASYDSFIISPDSTPYTYIG
jgi:hypothetical protein